MRIIEHAIGIECFENRFLDLKFAFQIDARNNILKDIFSQYRSKHISSVITASRLGTLTKASALAESNNLIRE
jgi:hypothetical protein